ncbi:MAG: protein translocase subunit SecD [Candidatus Nealsonbacteria bacterium CG23_combo_of_CG06-09_8_20_14_all_36_12]|uniref:Protein translocase subunit SecD n=2 Tax=Candidatus Nealsoniibacteriota TaxID=1817911 RepID=A0A2H0TKV9_9BACT|nr:MAG: protein translocase subunit SecD [Candidatus Nealsonbacteria bacterium CG23_combo_of_CG06-09_8_20_14_all_36_12]PIR72783.1 MAG: protein translocase subunit SecD [Candidatus Nealsonbacteria bacterium CG10_big_fil_rev_8_21_14_0_10_36_23]
MSKKKTYIILILIFILAFFAANLSYPKYFNQGIDYLNSKLESLNFKFKLPHFPDIPFKLGLDLQGGSHLIYEADLSQVEEKEKSDSMSGLRDVIERRVNLFGVTEPLVQVQKEKLIVELAGIKDISEAIRMIGQTPYLEFREERDPGQTEQILNKIKEIEGKSMEEIQKIENWQMAMEDPYFVPTRLTGKYLKKAELGFDQRTPKPLVLLEFNDEGAKVFEELTSKNVGKQLAIYIDQVPISAPVVQEAISGGKAQITGNFTIDTAKELARNLNAGALPVPIKLISQQTVGPTLGKISLEQSLKAGILGFLAILLFMIIFYRIPGIFASISLLIYVSFILALFKLIPVTLTLAGIAGFILSMGMAVDANILIFSRMREELRGGRSYLISIEEGFRRAWPAIRDGNLTTILVGLILFGFGTSFVKGFALTLVIGNLVGMFTAIFITNNFLRSFSKNKSPR